MFHFHLGGSIVVLRAILVQRELRMEQSHRKRTKSQEIQNYHGLLLSNQRRWPKQIGCWIRNDVSFDME